MKKLLLIAIMALTVLTGCSEEAVFIDINSEIVDMSHYENMPVIGHNFEEIAPAEALRIMDEGGSAAVYYSYDTCPFCNKATAVVNDAAKEMEMTVYYVNVHPENADDEFYSVMDDTTIRYADFLSKDENGEPEFYVPNLFIIKNGELVGNHVALTDDYAGSGTPLTMSQHNELKNIYMDLMKRID